MAKRTAGPIRVTLRNGDWRPPKARKKRSTGGSIDPWKSKTSVTSRERVIASHISRLLAPLARRRGSAPAVSDNLVEPFARLVALRLQPLAGGRVRRVIADLDSRVPRRRRAS
jgi:hypothetical protein